MNMNRNVPDEVFVIFGNVVENCRSLWETEDGDDESMNLNGSGTG